MNVKTIKAITPFASIAGIVVLEWQAISHGIDGVLLSGSIAVIGGLGGYGIKELKGRQSRTK